MKTAFYRAFIIALVALLAGCVSQTIKSTSVPDLAASIQEAIVDALVTKTMNAAEETGVPTVAAGGGVLANRRLRERLTQECEARQLRLFLPSPHLCTDNGAMIGAAASFRMGRGETTPHDAEIDSSRWLGA